MKTKNEIEEIFDNISVEELRVLLTDYRKFKSSGYLESTSELRLLIQKVSDLSGNTFSSEIIGVTYKLLEIAAIKWLMTS